MINLNKIKPTDLWYVIGYIATDGYLSTDGRHINITSNTDFLRGVIDGDGNISTWIHRTNHNRQWCLRIYSTQSVYF